MRFGLIISYLFIILFLIVACNTESNSQESISFVPYNLTKHGIPVEIKIPQDAIISEDPQSREKALVVTSPQFNLHVEEYSLDSDEGPVSWLTSQKEDERLQGDFSRIVREDSLGFVVERKDKELGISYHFQYVVPKNKQLIVFSEGIPKDKNFDLQMIMQMYDAVQQ